MSEAQLEILASRAGLAVDWVDANGRPQRVSAPVLRAVLAGLGLPADSDEAIETSLLNLQLEQQNKRLPPC
jgi:4-alpha-glucanotransferase